VAAKLLGAPPTMLDNRTKADSSKRRFIIRISKLDPSAIRQRRARRARSTLARRFTALAAYPLAIYESTAERHCFGRGVAARARGGRASSRDRARVDPARSGRRCPAWSGDDGSIGTGTAGANDAGRTFDGVRGRNDTGQQGKNSRNGKQRKFHHLISSRGVVFR